jgi:hypothetical protein
MDEQGHRRPRAQIRLLAERYPEALAHVLSAARTKAAA